MSKLNSKCLLIQIFTDCMCPSKALRTQRQIRHRSVQHVTNKLISKNILYEAHIFYIITKRANIRLLNIVNL